MTDFELGGDPCYTNAMRSIGLDSAALLRVDGRLRALARELVRDTGEAEDLVQETWVAALEAGDIHSLPGWAATVLRRLVHDRRRDDERRRRREELAATSEALPAATELLEREEARRRVVEALLELAEPSRSTLILRFLEELPPRAVARRMDVPVETVRSRTRRGLAELRERLDRSFGSRETWCAALAHAYRHPNAAEAISTTLMVMSIHKKLAVAVILCALGWLALPREEEEARNLEERGSGPNITMLDSPRNGPEELERTEESIEREPLPEDSAAAARLEARVYRETWERRVHRFDTLPGAARTDPRVGGAARRARPDLRPSARPGGNGLRGQRACETRRAGRSLLVRTVATGELARLRGGAWSQQVPGRAARTPS